MTSLLLALVSTLPLPYHPSSRPHCRVSSLLYCLNAQFILCRAASILPSLHTDSSVPSSLILIITLLRSPYLTPPHLLLSTYPPSLLPDDHMGSSPSRWDGVNSAGSLGSIARYIQCREYVRVLSHIYELKPRPSLRDAFSASTPTIVSPYPYPFSLPLPLQGRRGSVLP